MGAHSLNILGVHRFASLRLQIQPADGVEECDQDGDGADEADENPPERGQCQRMSIGVVRRIVFKSGH